MKEAPLLTKEYRTIDYVSGPLIFVTGVNGASFGEIVKITLRDGEERTGQVLDISEDHAVVQVYEGTRGIDLTGYQGPVHRRTGPDPCVNGYAGPGLFRGRKAP